VPIASTRIAELKKRSTSGPSKSNPGLTRWFKSRSKSLNSTKIEENELHCDNSTFEGLLLDEETG